jgi:hypothetical protein
MTEQPFIVGLAQLRQLPTNREQKRVVFNEQKRIFDTLFEIEKKFVENIMQDKSPFEYKDTYNFFLELFNKEVENINQNLKPRWWIVNEHYFSENFKPQITCHN